MKLNTDGQDIIRKYVAIVDSIVNQFVPNTVPGEATYNKMMTYLYLRKKIARLFSGEDWDKSSKWRQMTLDEGIANAKKENNESNN